ncbi:MAG: hypothetical protein SAJ12_00810, partial [Jaaginema sp. PMC 1079.18]|nr:hypothetical protein [Jaaginema sp. PMC 1079.18]
TTPTSSEVASPAPKDNTPPQNRVKVFFPNPQKAQSDLGYVEPVWRRTDSMGVGSFAIAQLIAGPTPQEKQLGLNSALTLQGSSNCGGENFQLTIQNQIAKLQLCRNVVTAGIGDDVRAQSALTATLKQFPTVDTVIILDARGNCFGDLSGENTCLTQLPKTNTQTLNNQTRLALTHFGPIKIGMTVSQAFQAVGMPVPQPNPGEESCTYYNFQPQLEGVAMMVTEDRVARIDVNANEIETLSGAKIGSTEAEIQRLYPGQIKTELHPYDPQGKYLIFVPKDAQHRNYRAIFETDSSGTVQRFRSGKLPEVEFIEGCS